MLETPKALTLFTFFLKPRWIKLKMNNGQSAGNQIYTHDMVKYIE